MFAAGQPDGNSMARDNTTPAAEAKASPPPQPANDAGELGLAELAAGVLSRDIRPRVADVRRLAQAVLAAEKQSRKDTKQAKGKKDKRAAGKKSGKKRKLAKIPRQQSRK